MPKGGSISIESECGCVFNHQSQHSNDSQEVRRKSSSMGLSRWWCFKPQESDTFYTYLDTAHFEKQSFLVIITQSLVQSLRHDYSETHCEVHVKS